MLLGLISGLLLHIIFNILSTVLHLHIDNGEISSSKVRESVDPLNSRVRTRHVMYGEDGSSFFSHKRDLRRTRAVKPTSPQQNLFRQIIPEEDSSDLACQE